MNRHHRRWTMVRTLSLRLPQVLVALVAGLMVATPARAAEPDPQAPSPALEARARALYDQGMRHFNLSEYDTAIDAFKQGYKLSGNPGFLYNIAQAYRLKGDCAQAVTFYRNYLRADPQAENRAAVEERIASLAGCAPEPAPVRPAPITPAPPSRTATGLRVAGIVAVGVGLALAGTAIYFGLDARDASDQIGGLYRAGGTWDQTAQDTERRGRRSQTLMLALGISGGAAVVAGGVLFGLGWRAGRRERRAPVAMLPLPGGGLMAWAGSF
jgi:tetratricopeptide (TPR) repeat protein